MKCSSALHTGSFTSSVSGWAACFLLHRRRQIAGCRFTSHRVASLIQSSRSTSCRSVVYRIVPREGPTPSTPPVHPSGQLPAGGWTNPCPWGRLEVLHPVVLPLHSQGVCFAPFP